MKRVACLITAALLSCSVAACARNNTNKGQNQGRTTGLEPNRTNIGNPNVSPAPYGFLGPASPSPYSNITGRSNNTGVQNGMGIGNTGVGNNIGAGNNTGFGMSPNPTPYPGGSYGTTQGYGTAPGTRTGTSANLGNGNVTGTGVGTTQGTMYRDGTYTGNGDMYRSGKVKAIVKISGGRITGITLRRYDAYGREITDNSATSGNPGGGGITANIGQTKQDLVNKMIQAQTNDVTTSTTGDNDLVTNWKIAVGRALDQARR
jgi:uncharacterized protein with FMN-binding domain